MSTLSSPKYFPLSITQCASLIGRNNQCPRRCLLLMPHVTNFRNKFNFVKRNFNTYIAHLHVSAAKTANEVLYLPFLEHLTRDQVMVTCLQHMTALSPITVMLRHYVTHAFKFDSSLAPRNDSNKAGRAPSDCHSANMHTQLELHLLNRVC